MIATAGDIDMTGTVPSTSGVKAKWLVQVVNVADGRVVSLEWGNKQPWPPSFDWLIDDPDR